MLVHANAKLGLAGRLALVSRIEEGRSLRAAASAFGVSPATAHRWWHRWIERGRGPESLRVGYDYAHAVVDDHTRLAYVELHNMRRPRP